MRVPRAATPLLSAASSQAACSRPGRPSGLRILGEALTLSADAKRADLLLDILDQGSRLAQGLADAFGRRLERTRPVIQRFRFVLDHGLVRRCVGGLHAGSTAP